MSEERPRDGAWNIWQGLIFLAFMYAVPLELLYFQISSALRR